MKKNGKCKRVYLELKRQIEDYLKFKKVFDKIVPYQKPLKSLVLYSIDNEGNESSANGSNYSASESSGDEDGIENGRIRRRRFKKCDSEEEEEEEDESNNSTI